MERTLKFDFIADGRVGQTEDNLVKWDKELKKAFVRLPGVRITENTVIRHLRFSPTCEPKNSQWRKTYYIRKTRATTWDKIYETVNEVKVCVFHFI